LKVFYQVTPEHQEAANATLLEACRKLTTQQWYNTKNTLINHFQAEHGLKIRKDEIARGHKPKMSVADFMTVSKLSMRRSIDAKLVLHYLLVK
jgi:hypothetical protein